MFDFIKRLFAPQRKPFGYAPVIGGGKTVREIRIGEFDARLITDIESTGMVEYTHILAVFDSNGDPVFFAAAEVNSMAAEFGGGSHFLGIFDGSGHASLSDDDKWADLDTFANAAVDIVKKHFAIA